MSKVTTNGNTGFPFNVCILVVVLALILFGGRKPVEAGLWDVMKEWYESYVLGDVNEATIPETPVENVGEVGLKFVRAVQLDFDEETPGIGMVYWMGFSSHGTLLLTDAISSKAHEFNPVDGQYIRTFGRVGRGPGEYSSSVNMAVGSQRKVYLLDRSTGRILTYDRQGRYVEHIRSIHASRILTGGDGDVYVLKVNAMRIMELLRLDSATWNLHYRIPLSTDTHRFISYRMSPFAHLCYSPSRHRLYYLGPNDYQVKEIDAETGEIIRHFGRRPEGFIPLPKRYHGLLRGSFSEMESLEMTSVKSMTLIEDRFLFVSHVHQTLEIVKGESPIRWVLYDLTTSPLIEAYDLDIATQQRLIPLSSMTPWNSIDAWHDRLCIWSAPSEQMAESSNGNLEYYELFFVAN